MSLVSVQQPAQSERLNEPPSAVRSKNVAETGLKASYSPNRCEEHPLHIQGHRAQHCFVT